MFASQKFSLQASQRPKDRALGILAGLTLLTLALALPASAEPNSGSFLSSAVDWIGDAFATLKTMPPLVYFSAMALICVLPVPISPFYIASGPLFGFTSSILWIGGAIAFNQLFSHWLAAGFFRPILERFLAKRGHAIPKPRTPAEERLLTALIRITPGPPYALQNWILGLADVERVPYLLISWPIQMVHATAWVVLGQSAFDGDMGVAAFAIGLIFALGIGARWASVRLGVRRGNAAEPARIDSQDELISGSRGAEATSGENSP